MDNDVVFTYLQEALVELWEAYDNGVAVINLDVKRQNMAEKGNRWPLCRLATARRVLRDIYTPGGRPRFFGLGVLPFDHRMSTLDWGRCLQWFALLLPGDYPDDVYHVHHFYDEESEVEHGQYELIDHLINEIKDEKMVSIQVNTGAGASRADMGLLL